MLAVLLGALLFQDPLAVTPDTVRRVHNALAYDILIAVSDTGPHIVGEVEATWRLGSADPVVVPLDSAMRVVRVLIDGRENTRLHRTAYGRQGNIVYIPHAKGAGDTLRTRIRYHGTPADGLIIRRDSTGARTLFADNWPDRAQKWLPVQDHPSDKATVTWRVEVPADYSVIANGRLVKVDTLARHRVAWQYRLDDPIPTYGMVLGAGRLAVTPLTPPGCSTPCVPQSAWAYPADSAYAVQAFAMAPAIMEYFTAMLGPFPYPSLAHVQSSTIFGGSENASAIFYGDRLYARQRVGDDLIAHEMAHQWFGDAVTEADWHHLWLSEGFATYLAALWVGHARGDSAFRAVMQRNAESVFWKGGAAGKPTPNPVTERPIIDPEATDLMGLLNSNNYPKGAWVLHQLRGVVGDSAFYRGMRSYYERYRDSTALSSDFAREMERASGQDLEWFFREMLTLPGYPMLTVRWRHAGGELSLEIEQVQPAAWGVRRLPRLVIAVDGTRIETAVTGQRTTVTHRMRQPPGTVVVDPDGQWLLQARVERAP